MSKLIETQNLYWRVHISELSKVKDITDGQLNTWKMIMNDNNDEFIFITRCSNLSPWKINCVGFMPEGKNKKKSIEWFKRNGYKYQGEFNKARERKQKLKKLCQK